MRYLCNRDFRKHHQSFAWNHSARLKRLRISATACLFVQSWGFTSFPRYMIDGYLNIWICFPLLIYVPWETWQVETVRTESEYIWNKGCYRWSCQGRGEEEDFRRFVDVVMENMEMVGVRVKVMNPEVDLFSYLGARYILKCGIYVLIILPYHTAVSNLGVFCSLCWQSCCDSLEASSSHSTKKPCSPVGVFLPSDFYYWQVWYLCHWYVSIRSLMCMAAFLTAFWWDNSVFLLFACGKQDSARHNWLTAYFLLFHESLPHDL